MRPLTIHDDIEKKISGVIDVMELWLTDLAHDTSSVPRSQCLLVLKIINSSEKPENEQL
jgi:hypothetical protein